MSNKRILYVRGSSAQLNFNKYNVQEIGLGKSFCELAEEWCYKINEHKLRVIPTKGMRLFRSRINLKILNSNFLSRYDLIISSEYGQIMTYLLSRKNKNVLLYSGPYYNLFKIPFISPIYDFLFNQSINNNCRAKFVKSVLAKKYLEGKGYTDIKVIGVGLDTTRFDCNVDILPETKKIQNFMKEHPCLLYVGSLSRRKNFSFLIKVFNRFHEIHTDICLVIIGNGNSRYIKKCLNELNIKAQRNIIRINAIDNSQLQFLYPLAKAFILPSKREIFGMVLLESMYLGAPVITSNNGGSSTLIEGRNTGIIVDDFEVNHWVDAIEKILTDSANTKEMISMAHDLVKTKYSWLNLAKEMLETVGLNY